MHEKHLAGIPLGKYYHIHFNCENLYLRNILLETGNSKDKKLLTKLLPVRSLLQKMVDSRTTHRLKKKSSIKPIRSDFT